MHLNPVFVPARSWNASIIYQHDCSILSQVFSLSYVRQLTSGLSELRDHFGTDLTRPPLKLAQKFNNYVWIHCMENSQYVMERRILILQYHIKNAKMDRPRISFEKLLFQNISQRKLFVISEMQIFFLLTLSYTFTKAAWKMQIMLLTFARLSIYWPSQSLG